MIPQTLTDIARWRAWGLVPRQSAPGKYDKVPAFGASTADPSQWGAFSAGVDEQQRGGFDGVGLCMTGLTGLVGLDFDNVIEDGVIAPWASEIIAACDSYAETSPSGRGIRVFARGTLPGGDLINHAQGFEAYTGQTPRFLTVTGHRLAGVPADLGVLTPEAVALIESYRTKPGVNGKSPAPNIDNWVRSAALGAVNETTIADLRSALTSMNVRRAVDRNEWINVLMALASLKATPFAADALKLATEFSARCPAKFDPVDLVRRWNGLHPGAITYRSIFKWAAEDGWINPRTMTPATSYDAASSFFPASELAGTIAAPRQWLCEGLIPSRTVTLLNGDGGVGKSLLALQLAVAVASGRPWLARRVTHGGALFISAEDDRAEIHRRIMAIASYEQIPVELLNRLTLRSLAGCDALLATLDRARLVPTPLYHELDGRIGDERPAIVVLDTLADLFPGNENDRAQARHFIGLLRGLAIRHECAVLLLAHPSLTGLNTGTGTSGSTAWNNSVRSRIYLDRIKADGFEPNQDTRRLTTMKANYGRTGDEIVMTWRAGLFITDRPDENDGALRVTRAQRVFMALLREYAEQGRYISASPGPTYAPTQFASHPAAEGCTKRVLKAAMDQLFSLGTIKIETHGSGTKARSHIVEVKL